ncbi:hypothetical protein V5O48_018575, partial [Marasmius crinis-equi]
GRANRKVAERIRETEAFQKIAGFMTIVLKYDHTKGGHLVLWDLRMVIEFPPGTTIFIPSAVLCHLNTSIQEGETRYSFTMYSAGGLFRWVEHGFQLENIYRDTVQAVCDAKRNATRWARGLSMYSTIDELLQTPEQML